MRDVAPRVAAALPGVIVRGPARTPDGAPAAYLTFDDGPTRAGTGLLVDLLDRHSARATFFVTGSLAAAAPDSVRALADAGHAVGSHGWSHADAWADSRALDDLRRGTERLEDLLGRPVTDVRPPYGHVTPGTYRWARSTGRRIVLWDSMPGDFMLGDVDALAKRVRRLRPGSIVALHDGPPAATAAAVLDSVLPRLADAGWRFPSLPPC